MAKRKLSRTDTRTTGGRRSAPKSTAKKSASRTSDARTERPKRKFSDTPSDRKRPTSRFGREEGNSDRPKRNTSSERRGYSTGSSSTSSRSERPFDKKKPFNREGGDKKFSRDGFSSSSKPRRGFPEGFKREEGDSEKARPKRSFRATDGSARSGGFRKESDRPFDKKKSFGDRSDRPKRNFSSDQPREERSTPFGKKPFDREERPKRDFDGDKEVSPRKFAPRDDKPFERKNPLAKSDRANSDERPRRRFDADKESTTNDEQPFERKKSFDRGVKSESDKRPRKSFSDTKTGDYKSYGKTRETPEEQPTQIRLNRYIANSGVSSRREADEIIKMGLVTVNGTTITEMGYQVQPGDVVKHEGKMLRAEKNVYILMNKPKGVLTTTRDPEDRATVLELVSAHVKERIYPVGRLDRNTTGLLLLTNDGALADQLSHPSYNVKKIYKVELDRPLAKADFEKIGQGVYLEEGRAMVDDVAIVSEDGKTVGIEIHIGWNRVVRRIFESLEYQVMKLDRTIYAGLDKKDLPRGHWRHLREEEVIRLKHLKKGTK
jgi:23S rRNA pseudouridine2605 synthase